MKRIETFFALFLVGIAFGQIMEDGSANPELLADRGDTIAVEAALLVEDYADIVSAEGLLADPRVRPMEPMDTPELTLGISGQDLRIDSDIGMGIDDPLSALHLYQNRYTLYGPNTSWGAYLQVGGNGRVTTYASVAATNGNLHLDAADGSYATYINYYSQNNTYINARNGNVGIGTVNPFDKMAITGRLRFGTNAVSYQNAGAGAVSGDPTHGIGWGNQPLDEYGIYVGPQETIYSGNYTKLVMNWHTGIKIGAHTDYGGITFWSNSMYASPTELFSIGRGDNHVRVNNNLFAQYLNSTDNSVSSGVTGIMVKCGDNYYRTATSGAIGTFLGNYGNWIPNNGSGDWQIASSSDATGYSNASLELRERNFGGASYRAPRLSFHWGGVVASQIGIESSGRIAILNNPGTGYESLVTSKYCLANGFELQQGGSNYGQFNSWVHLNGHYGLYAETNSAHFYPNNGTYGAWKISGTRNGYGGVNYNSRTVLMMQDDLIGLYNEYYGRWIIYGYGSTGNTYIAPSGGNVGIGTTSPNGKLHVNDPTLRAYSLTYGAAAAAIIRNENSELAMGLHNASPWPYWIQARTSSSGARDIALQPLGGNIGIGTTSPSQKLDVNGNLRTTGYAYFNHSSPSLILQDTDQRNAVIHCNSNLLYFLSGNGVNGTGWSINGSYWPLYLNMNTDEAVFGGPAYFMEGNVGIRTTGPTSPLYVYGNNAAGNPSTYITSRNSNWALWIAPESGYSGAGGAFTGSSGHWGLVCIAGSKSAVVKTSEGPTALFCMESPEVWFEDIGGGKLIDGKAHIEIDPLFLETVTIDDENPMRVFIQPNGESNGLIVIKGKTGFDVIEQNSGTSNIAFDYRILAKRKYFETDRLTVWPNPTHEHNPVEQADIDYISDQLRSGMGNIDK